MDPLWSLLPIGILIGLLISPSKEALEEAELNGYVKGLTK